MQAFPITQSSLIALLTFVVGQVAAFVPSFGTYQSVAISVGTAVVALGFQIANAIHAHAARRPVVVAPAAPVPVTTPTGATSVQATVTPTT